MENSKSVIHVDMDAFYASVERNRKNLEGPIVVCVYSGRSKDSGAVSTCSYDARELGIHAAMPIKRTKRIAEESGEDVNFVAMDREYYREVSDRIREEVLENYSDKIEQASIDEAYLELEEKVEEAVSTAREIQEKVREEFDLTCSVGVATNKLVAKIASDREKPEGLTAVKEEEIEDFMQSLELGEIHGIGGKTIEKLDELGIDSVKKLAEADEQLLSRELGENQGLKLKKKAQGKSSSEVKASEQKQITRITTLKENSDRASYIDKYFPELADEIMEKVAAKGIAFRKISQIAIDADIEMQTRSTTLKSHVQEKEKILEEGEKLLKKFLTDFDGEVRRIGLRVSDLKEFERQKNLGQF
jgi:DNA polymerase IV (DinB-like DNA polymerase)